MVMFELLTCICRINEVVRRHSVTTATYFSASLNVSHWHRIEEMFSIPKIARVLEFVGVRAINWH